MANKEIKILEDKRVIIRPIVKPSGFYPKGHDGEFMYTGCNTRFTLPYERKTHSFAKIFGDDPQEAKIIQREFEKELSKKEGELNLYDRNNKNWTSLYVELDKNETVLDLSNAIHALQYRILKANRYIIAPSWESRFERGSYQWALCDPEIVEKEDSRKGDLILKATELLGKIQNSETQMSNILRLLDKKIPKGVTKDWLKNEIAKMFTQIEKTAGVLSIHDFINTASDPRLSDKIFVMDALDAKAVVLEDGVFKNAETGDLLGKSLESVVEYFNDNANQNDKLLISNKIKRFSNDG